jgi:uncharacterized protein YndB with AHSA1/START domain
MTAGADPVIVERRVEASPETVFMFFSEPARWLQWQGVEAELDPRPGGTFRMNVRGDGTLVRLTHRNLPPDEVATHQAGWSHYLARLATRAGGGQPGPDPWRLD